MQDNETPVTIAVFLLKGKVQGVKMRRYVESAGRHFGVGGYCININHGEDEGAVFGEAWVRDQNMITPLKNFTTWVSGQWKPAIYTNVKPVPVGTAYPEKANVQQMAVKPHQIAHIPPSMLQKYSQFTMIRDEQEATTLSCNRRDIQKELSTALLGDGTERGESSWIEVGSWPKRKVCHNDEDRM